MFSAFWEETYIKNFDNETLLVPVILPNTDMATFPVLALGAILSHGFMVCSLLPVRIAFPVFAAVLGGPGVKIPDATLLD